MPAFIVAMFAPGPTELFIIMLIMVLPPILILISPRTCGSKKFGWFLITLFLSWLGYGFFLALTNKQEKRNGTDVSKE